MTEPTTEWRRWLRDSTPAERWLTAIAAAVGAALLAWTLVPIGERQTSIMATSAQPAPTVVAGETSIAGDPGRGGVAVAPVVPSPIGEPGDTAVPTGDRDVATDVGVAPAERPVASDRGITDAEIKVGFSVLDVGGVQDAGFGVPTLRNDVEDVIRALVDDVNGDGGVHGRALVPVIKHVDILSANDQRSKCLSFVRDEQVFAVIDAISYQFSQTRGCVSKEYETPFITYRMGSRAEVESHAPFHVGMTATDNLMVRDWVRGAVEAGFFDRSKGFVKLGIFSDSCDRTVNEDPVDGLHAQLRRAGVEEWSEFVVECDTSAWPRSGPAALLQHRRDGVTHVFFGVSSLAANSYLRAAEAQQFRPQYFVSDFHGMTSNGIVKNFPPEQWDRVRGVTETREAEIAIGKPLSPRARRCADRIAAAGLPPVQDYTVDGEVLMFCQHLDLFVDVARRTPVNFTRHQWLQALGTVGDFDPATTAAARFDPGVFAAGGRMFAVVEYRRECSCYHQVADFRSSQG